LGPVAGLAVGIGEKEEEEEEEEEERETDRQKESIRALKVPGVGETRDASTSRLPPPLRPAPQRDLARNSL
ncbi:hypothetical protein P7K49_028361, partial [Saguinus oedipus]